MTFAQLQYFKVIATSQSISSAAKELSVSQPALSNMLSQLEAELGTSLFDRSGKHLTLNRAGEQFLNTATKVLNLIDESVANLKNSHQISGSLRVGGHIFCSQFCEDMAAFTKEYPDVMFRLDSAEKLINNPMHSHYDLVMLPDYECTDISRVILEERKIMYAALPRSHPLAGRKTISLIELKEDYFYFVSPRDGRMEYAYNRCIEAGFTPKCRYIVDAGFAFADLFSTESSVMLTYNTHTIYQHIDSLVLVPIEGEPFPKRRCICLCLPGEAPSTLAQIFFDFVAQRHP